MAPPFSDASYSGGARILTRGTRIGRNRRAKKAAPTASAGTKSYDGYSEEVEVIGYRQATETDLLEGDRTVLPFYGFGSCFPFAPADTNQEDRNRGTTSPSVAISSCGSAPSGSGPIFSSRLACCPDTRCSRPITPSGRRCLPTALAW